MLSPRSVHRFVGYLEEEAVHTYTCLLKEIDRPESKVHIWNYIPADKDIREYYNLPDGATFRDVVLCIRADEACHRDVNHTFASMNADEEVETHDIIFSDELRSSIGVKEHKFEKNYIDPKEYVRIKPDDENHHDAKPAEK